MEAPNLIVATPDSKDDDHMLVEVASSGSSAKLRNIRMAVVLACAPLAPSRNLGSAARTPRLNQSIAVTRELYKNLAPSSRQNSRLDQRLQNKISYADEQTQVFVEWLDSRSSAGRDSLDYRSYNVRNHPDPAVIFRPFEVGWQDPVTVYVVHKFALLPGPGRLLAKHIIRADGLPDRVSQRIQKTTIAGNAVYTTTIRASATMTCEGIKSVRPYVHVDQIGNSE
jgi:hypothetical protein